MEIQKDNNKRKPLVSIIVPVYNAEKTLENCLTSLTGQSYSKQEIILVDDGSTDGSFQICSKFEQRFPEMVRIMHQDNVGPASARNKGIENSLGEYLAFADSDDRMAPEMIQTMVRVAVDCDADMVICAYWKESGTNRQEVCYKLPEGLYQGEKIKEVAYSYLDENPGDIPPYSWVRLVKKEILEKNGLQYATGLMRSEDYHFWAKVQFAIDKVYLLSSKPLYYYVVNDSSITHRYVKNYWRDVLYIYRDLSNTLPQDDMVQRKLKVMLIRRSLIALNNSSRCPKMKQAFRDMKEIIEEKELQEAIQFVSTEEGAPFVRYRKLMQGSSKPLLLCKYMGRHLKNKVHLRKSH